MEPAIAIFESAGEPARRVTISGARGIVIVEAEELVLSGRRPAVARATNMPGEPFIDLGVDLDGDGEIESGLGDHAWSVDGDGDGALDAPGRTPWHFGRDSGPG